jgi:prepilin-type N-terminal cleavage/methylation domain-containing protein
VKANSNRIPGALTRAFTLIELLVVVAIIAILAAIAVPVAGSAFDSGANTSDMNNLRQIGVAISQFAADNNNRFPNTNISVPGADIPGDPPTPRLSFMESVDRFMPPDGKFFAGSLFNFNRRPLWFSKRFAQMPSGKSFNPSSQYYWGTAWGMNTYLWNLGGPGSTTNMRSYNGYLSRVPNLSKLVLVGEKNRNGGHDFRPYEAPTFERDVESSYRISRNNRAYYLFADYHIELIEGDQSIMAHPEYNTYNATNRLYYRW